MQLILNWSKHKHHNDNISEELHHPGPDTSFIFQDFHQNIFHKLCMKNCLLLRKFQAIHCYGGGNIYNILPTPQNSLSQQSLKENSADILLCMGFNAISLSARLSQSVFSTQNAKYIWYCILSIHTCHLTSMIFAVFCLTKMNLHCRETPNC